MLIAIVSDTHGALSTTLRAMRMIESFAPAAVLHCGDVGGVEIVRLFRNWPTHWVRGNCDGDVHQLSAEATKQGNTWHGDFGVLEFADRSIALLHGDDGKRLYDTVDSQTFDLVCHGHTHVAAWRQHGKTWVLNPGALYRAARHTIALVDLKELSATHVVVD